MADHRHEMLLNGTRNGDDPLGISNEVLDPVVEVGADLRVRAWNAAAERCFGLAASEAVGRELAELIVSEPERGARRVELARLVAADHGDPSGRRLRMEAERWDGSRLPVELTLVAMVTDGDRRLCALVKDISATVAVERRLDRADRRFERAFHDAPIGKALVALDGSFLEVNEALCVLLGRPACELLAGGFQAVAHPDDRQQDPSDVAEVLAGRRTRYEVERRYVRPDGRTVWALLSVSLVRDADGAPEYFVSQLQDITARKLNEHELRRYSDELAALSRTDAQTGLVNRRELEASLDREIARCRRHGGGFSLVLLDAGQLTAPHRGRGYVAAVDDLLRRVATALVREARGSDLAARTGIDEFALLLPETSHDEAHVAAQRIARACDSADGSVRLGCGVAAYPEAGDTRQMLTVRAEMALYGDHRAAVDAPAGAAPEGTERILELARTQLRMPIAYLTKHTSDVQSVEAAVGTSAGIGLAPGAAVALEESYCAHMLAGRLANAVADTHAEPLTREMTATREGGVRAYVGVPVRLSDGTLHGTLCALDTEIRTDIGEREIALLDFLAGTVAERIEHDRETSVDLAAQTEVSGIHALVAALSARDHYTSEHSQGVVALAGAVAHRFGLEAAAVTAVEQVALLHDIGKVGIPDAILQKPGPLDQDEWELMRQHPLVGARVVEASSSLGHLSTAVRAEHERWDGTGYPDGLIGSQIPLASRIVFACDAYQAMTSDRCYRAAMDPHAARDELQAGSDGQFDPVVVAKLLRVLDDEPEPIDVEAIEGRDRSREAVLRCGQEGALSVWKPLVQPGRGWVMAEVRCVCGRCGAHLVGNLSLTKLAGACANCGSYDITLLEDDRAGSPQSEGA